MQHFKNKILELAKLHNINFSDSGLDNDVLNFTVDVIKSVAKEHYSQCKEKRVIQHWIIVLADSLRR